VARRKLLQLHAATDLICTVCAFHPATRWKPSKVTDWASTASASTPNGACASLGTTMEPTAWKSWTTTEHSRARHMTTELLDEIHPGEILLEDFMKPLGITARQLAADMDAPPPAASAIS
jgi:hypothetical protein